MCNKHCTKNDLHQSNQELENEITQLAEYINAANYRLDELPLINKAFSKGEISYSKVRAMTRAATNENEEFLMMLAKHGTASHIE